MEEGTLAPLPVPEAATVVEPVAVHVPLHQEDLVGADGALVFEKSAASLLDATATVKN